MLYREIGTWVASGNENFFFIDETDGFFDKT